MAISDEKISHLAHRIWAFLYDEDWVDYPDEEKSLKAIKTTLGSYLKMEDEIDDLVRYKIGSLKRGVQEGSREWDILYRKYFEEEAQKRKF